MTDKTKLVCPQCNAINQFSHDKPAIEANCGKCRKPLLTGTPIEVNNTSIKRYIHHSGIPILVDFWAPWCGPCRMFVPTYQSYANNKSDRMICLKVNTEEHQQSGADYNIRSIPTLALFQDGREVARISGAMNENQE